MTAKKIAILTSGGDAPGMNACIRAVTLAAASDGIDVIGFRHGYNGLLENEWVQLTTQMVHNLLQRGGTILHSARCEKFKLPEQIKLAGQVLENHELDGLIVVGGNGSFLGALALQAVWNKPVIGIP
ncbi:MAG: 6-phosphofructokinase, partial [Pseudomonadota bacterium]